MDNVKSLAQINIDNLHMKGIYKSPTLNARNIGYENRYFTFKPVQKKDKYFMECTLSKELIELTDDNFNDFVVLCKDVEEAIKRQLEAYLSQFEELN